MCKIVAHLSTTIFLRDYYTWHILHLCTAPADQSKLPQHRFARCRQGFVEGAAIWLHPGSVAGNTAEIYVTMLYYGYTTYIYIYTGYIYIYVCMFVSRISQEICKINYSIGWCLMWIILPSSTHFGFQECTLPGHMAIETSRVVVEAQFGQTNCLCFAAKSMVVCTSICP